MARLSAVAVVVAVATFIATAVVTVDGRAVPSALPCPSLPFAEDSSRCGPSFSIIGAYKAATTSIFAHLAKHPQVAVPLGPGGGNATTSLAGPDSLSFSVRQKELAALANPLALQKEPEVTTEYYLSLFPTLRASDGLVTGDASPEYLGSPIAPDAMNKIAPDTKLIVVLRDPVDRANSQHNHDQSVSWGTKTREGMTDTELETLTLEEFLPQTGDAISECSTATTQSDVTAYQKCLKRATQKVESRAVVNSLYDTHLEHWLSVFSQEQLLVVKFEDFVEDEARVMDQITDFIGLRKIDWTGIVGDVYNVGVDANAKQGGQIVSASKDVRKPDVALTPGGERLLRTFFAPVVRKTEALVGRTLWSGDHDEYKSGGALLEVTPALGVLIPKGKVRGSLRVQLARWPAELAQNGRVVVTLTGSDGVELDTDRVEFDESSWITGEIVGVMLLKEEGGYGSVDVSIATAAVEMTIPVRVAASSFSSVVSSGRTGDRRRAAVSCSSKVYVTTFIVPATSGSTGCPAGFNPVNFRRGTAFKATTSDGATLVFSISASAAATDFRNSVSGATPQQVSAAGSVTGGPPAWSAWDTFHPTSTCTGWTTTAGSGGVARFNGFATPKFYDLPAIACSGSRALLCGKPINSAGCPGAGGETESQSPAPGGGGDPVIVDFYGHKFPAGSEPNTEYLLYSNNADTEAIYFTTSNVDGMENDYFIESVRIVRDNCGEAKVTVDNTQLGTTIETTSECMASRLSSGDNGIVAVAIGSGEAVAVLVPHHEAGKTFSFMNVKIAGDWQQLRDTGCGGMLCDERHEGLVL